MNKLEEQIWSGALVENSLYTTQDEYDNLLKDKEKIADALLFNLFGFVSLFAATPKKDVKEWKNNEKSVRIDKVTEENTDVTISLKLAYDAKMIPRSTVDKITRMLALFKQGGILKANDVNDDLVHDLFMLCKFDTINKPSPRLRPIVDEYVNRETNIAFLAKDLYKLSKLPDFKVMSLEFFNMYKHGAYAQVYSTLENGVKHLPMGIPAKHLKIVTDKTVHHVKKSTVDVTGATQIDQAVATTTAQSTAQADEIKDDIKKTVASVSNPVEVVAQDPVDLPSQQAIEEPTVDLDQKVDEVIEQAKTFDPTTDEMDTSLPPSPYIDAMKENGFTNNSFSRYDFVMESAKTVKFDFDHHLSSIDAFIQGYKEFMMIAPHGDGIGDEVIARVNKYLVMMDEFVETNAINTPSWMVDYGIVKTTLANRFDKDDEGVAQSLYLITLSYFLSTMSQTNQYRVGLQIKYIASEFSRLKDASSFVKGKKLYPKVQKLLQKHGADLNFDEVTKNTLDAMQKSDIDTYRINIYPYMFIKFFFDIRYGIDYKLPKMFHVIKEMNEVDDRRIKPTASEKDFYGQFVSNLVYDKKVFIDDRNYHGIAFIPMDDETFELIRGLNGRVSPFMVMSFGSMMMSRSVSKGIEYIGKIYEENGTKPDVALIERALEYVSNKSSIITGLESLHQNPNFQYVSVLNIFTKFVLKDIAEKGTDSYYLKHYDSRWSMPLATVVTSDKINTSDPEMKAYVERIKPMLFEIEKMYDVDKLADAEKSKIDKFIDQYKENETLLNLNLNTSIDEYINDYKTSTYKGRQIDSTINTLSKIIQNADYLASKGVNVDTSKAVDFIRNEIQTAIDGTNSVGGPLYLLRILSNNSGVLTTKPLKMYLEMVKDKPEIQQEAQVILRTNFDNLVKRTDFDQLFKEYSWLGDDLGIELYDEVVRVNGVNVRTDVDDEQSVNTRKFAKAYIETLKQEYNENELIPASRMTEGFPSSVDLMMYDAIRHGYVDARDIVDGNSIKGILDGRTATDIAEKIHEVILKSEPSIDVIAMMYIADNPDSFSHEELERVVEVASIPRDIKDTFTFEMTQKFCKESLSKAIFRDMNWGDIVNLPESVRNVAIEDKISKEYSSTIAEHLGAVNQILVDTQIELLTENISDHMLTTISKINGIGLQNAGKIDFAKFNSKEEFEQNISNVVSENFLDDINNTNVMDLVDSTTDPEIMKPANRKLYNTSNGNHGNVAPIITKMFKVDMDRTRFNAFVEKDKLNPNSDSKGEIRQFMVHGTGSIAAAFITKFGFREIPEGVGLFTTGKMLGPGIYLAENIDKSLSYIGDGSFNKTYKEGYVLMVDACLGEYDVDYLDARGFMVVSPEWCIKNFQDQIVVTEVYQVRSATIDQYMKYIGDE